MLRFISVAIVSVTLTLTGSSGQDNTDRAKDAAFSPDGSSIVTTSDDVPRAVSAHVDGIMEALVKIYDAHRVADELTGK